MKFTDAVLPIAVIAIIALGAYFVLSDKMIQQDNETGTGVMVADPTSASGERVGSEPEVEEPVVDNSAEGTSSNPVDEADQNGIVGSAPEDSEGNDATDPANIDPSVQ